MLFDFLKNKKTDNETNETNEDNDILARVSYVITKNSDSTIVDVELNEYNTECTQALCDIMAVLSEDKFLADTIDIIKNAMLADNKQDILIKFFSYLDIQTKTKLLNTHQYQEDPCIKPSEVFLNRE